jgi:hypothetical protein
VIWSRHNLYIIAVADMVCTLYLGFLMYIKRETNEQRIRISRANLLVTTIFFTEVLFSKFSVASPPAQLFTWVDATWADALASSFGEVERHWFLGSLNQRLQEALCGGCALDV